MEPRLTGLARPVAIVGIGCRFPGGVDSPQRFWELLCNGTDAIREAPAERLDLDLLFDPDPAAAGKLYTRWGGYIDGIDAFDADFFGIAPREARRMDPQQRLLLEVVWEALEHAGQPPDRLAGTNAGVFIGISSHDYTDIQVLPLHRERIDAHFNAGGATCIAANRISYLLDLRGPSFAVDTACSSSLTALHLACRSLAVAECNVAIVGGVNVLLAAEPTIGFCRATMLSPDGRCHSFDARANGYVRAEGAGAVVLKPLARAISDGDTIHAVIRGTAVNQDGRTPGMSLPSADGQAAMLRQALAAAGVPAAAVQYVEAHGTGTAAGDPVEAEAIGRVFSAGRAPGDHCVIGSVKTNVGHLEAGAGVAGLIKATLALQHRLIPPNLHFSVPNPAIRFDELRLRVPTRLEPWPVAAGPALAGVNSFGFGGANAHAVLEEPPAAQHPHRIIRGGPEHGIAHVLALSARTPDALRELATRHAQQLADERSPISLHDRCYTAAVRRMHHPHRVAAVATSASDMALRLQAFAAGEEEPGLFSGRVARSRTPKLAFVFTGMGAQWWRMGRQLLHQEAVLRAVVDEIDALLRPMTEWSLLDELTADERTSRITRTDIVHVANFAIQAGLTALLRSWGIVPDAVVGHSSGEMAAAYAAGALTLHDAAHLAFERGRLQHRTTGTGRMLAVAAGAEEAAGLIAGHEASVAIAAINGPSAVTLSGEARVLEQIAAAFARAERFCRFIAVDVPYHGPQMDAIREDLLAALADLEPVAATTPVVSEVTGDFIAGTELDAGYWWRNVREPVRFAAAIDRLIDHGCDVFLELGPHPILSPSIMETCAARGANATVLPTLRRGDDERRTMLNVLASLHVRDRSIAWQHVYPDGVCVPLPSYPWQRERHWFETGDAASARTAGTPSGHPLLGRRLPSPRPVWESVLGGAQLGFLEQHVVQDSIVFPAAAYVEMLLAAAHQLWGDVAAAAADISFRRMLFLTPRDACVLQLHHDPGRASAGIHAANGGGDDTWDLHASATLRRAAAAAGAEQTIEELRARCAIAVDIADLYESFERHGLRYGPAFRGIRELWRHGGEALARIALDDDLAQRAGSYRAHPALLDAAFQVLGSAAASGGGAAGPFVPVALERAALYAPVGGACWVHAGVTRRAGSTVEGDITLLDDGGHVLFACRGLKLSALEGARQEHIADWLYEMRWEETALPATPTPGAASLPTPQVLATSVREALPEAPAGSGPLAAWYRVVEPALHRTAIHYVRSCMGGLGCLIPSLDVERDALAEQLGVLPQHRRLFGRLLEILQAEDQAGEADSHDFDPRELAARMVLDHPGHSAEFELLERCGSRLADVLRGEVDPRDVLFGDGFDALARIYGTSPMARCSNELAAEAVARAARSATERNPLRVLEIGAGTGALTEAVLARLGASPVQYVFTDVSTYFLNRARNTYGERAGMSFELFDIEKHPAEQQFGGGPFDVVLGANVVHATQNLRRTLSNLRCVLAPGGLLVLVEVTRRAAWFDLIFGLLEGWWRFADHELRPAHPLLTRAAWSRPLGDAGFIESTALADPPRTGEPMMSVLIARAPAQQPPAAPANWLLLVDGGGAGDRIASALSARGDHCVIVRAGAAFKRHGDDCFEAAPIGGDIDRVVDAAGPIDVVVHLWSLDIDAAAETSAADVMDAQVLGCGAALELVHALERRQARPAALWFVTAGAQSVDDTDDVRGVAQAPLWGFARVLRNEQPTLHARLIDVSAEPSPDEVDALITELSADDAADEVAVRGSRRFVQRLQRARPDESTDAPTVRRSPGEVDFQLEIGTPGALDTLRLRETASIDPQPGHVLIRVLAAGLNFRDVMLALGMLPPAVAQTGTEAGTHSVECSGIVVSCGAGVVGFAPGDEVIALAVGSLGSRAVARSELVVRKPPHLSFEDAASIPGIYLTARYGLLDLARMQPGERVLIHGASGGVGHAALQLCSRAGAEIFATAGTPEKRAYLHALGVQHVMNSRSLDWADEVLERTGGEGVDVVLNSLAGAAIRRGLEVLRPFGRFVEIGKRDIYDDADLGLLPFRKNLGFFSVDLVRLCDERPAVAGVMLREVVDDVANGTLALPPRTDIDIARAEDAYRLMAQARHIGKVVITLQQPEYAVVPAADRALVHGDATYLITGGVGGFGLAVAGWLVREGARHLVLLSRSGETRDNTVELERLRQTVSTLRIVRADVTSEADVAGVLADIEATMPPLRGVLHLAMVLDDGMLTQLDHERFATALRPKIAGAWNLDRLTARYALDHFILFSSISSVIGHPLQGNYAAGNTFLDALAACRRARGLPGLAISWGTVAEVGYVARHAELQQHLARLGIESLSPAQALAALEAAMRGSRPHIVAARLEWNVLRRWNRTQTDVADPAVDEAGAGAAQHATEARGGLLPQLRAASNHERSTLLEAHVLQRVSKVLGSTSLKVDPERQLTEMGLDSLLAVELLTALRIDLGVQIPVVKLLQGASARELTGLVLDELRLDASALASEPAAPRLSNSSPANSPPAASASAISPPAAEPVADAPVVFVETSALSFEQRRFWFLERLQPGDPALHMFAGARLTGPLDAHALQRSLQEVAARHEMLRSCYRDVDGEPVQAIASRGEVRMQIVDLRALPAEEREAALQRRATEEIRRPFDLAQPPLLRGLLVRLAEDVHALLLVVHHIVADAWAMTLVARDTMAIYGALTTRTPVELPSVHTHYSDYVRHQRAVLDGDRAAAQLRWWQHHLESAPPLHLPADRSYPGTGGSRGARHHFELSTELSAALRELGRAEGSTLFAMLFAAFQMLLHRYSDSSDITIGTPVLRRDGAGFDELVGCCMNTLALRCDLSGDPSFRELLRRVRELTVQAFAHQDVPYEAVVHALRPAREPGRVPLFRAMLILHNLRWPELRMGPVEVRPLAFDSGAAVSDVMLLVDTGDRLHGTLEYNAALFDAATAAGMVDHFRTLLQAIVEDPDVPLSRTPLSSETERRRVLIEFNDTDADLGAVRCVHELVEAQVARTPHALAVVSETERITYHELDARASRLAHALRKAGAEPGVVVGVHADRSVALVVAALGVLKAGAAFLPLDPALPAARLEVLLRQARPRVVLAGEALDAALDPPALITIGEGGLEIDGRRSRDAGHAGVVAAVREVSPDDIAYVIFTSGSTGQPKGVVVPHRALCNQIQWRQAAFPLTDDDAVLQRTPIGFDPAIWELFGPLAVGARLVIPRAGTDNDGAYLTALMAEHGVTTLQIVPSLLDALLEEPGLARCGRLCRVFCGGEPLTPALMRRFFATLPAELHNLYGPAEATIDAASFTCRGDEDVVPIGRPIANVRTYVLDEHMQPAAIGVPGELYIAGAGLALCYLGQPEQTRERFVPDPFGAAPALRLYRTGDRARWRHDGQLEFLGRTDDQLKIRGTRFESAEVEGMLGTQPGVREAAVVVHGATPAERRLVAFAVPDGGAQLQPDALLRLLSTRLPAALVPAAVVLLDALPRTSAGKVDRTRLAQVAASSPAGRTDRYLPPRNDTEAQLAAIWEQLLDLRPVGVSDDFFALGGHSLLAMRLVARVHRVFGRELPISILLEAPTIEAMASRLLAEPAPAAVAQLQRPAHRDT